MKTLYDSVSVSGLMGNSIGEPVQPDIPGDPISPDTPGDPINPEPIDPPSTTPPIKAQELSRP